MAKRKILLNIGLCFVFLIVLTLEGNSIDNATGGFQFYNPNIPYIGVCPLGDLSCEEDVTTTNTYTYYLNSTLWNRTGTNTFLANIGDYVGIGTINPTHELNVVGDVNITGLYYGNGSQLTGIDTNLIINTTLWNRSGLNVFLNNPNDRVGIGTNSPAYSLEIAGNINNLKYIAVENTDTGTLASTGLRLKSSNGYGYFQIHSASKNLNRYGIQFANWTEIYARDGVGLAIGTGTYANPIIFGTNSLERMRITSGGNVGIGTANPSHELNVVGDVNITGNFTGNQIRGEMWYHNHTATELNFAVDGIFYNLTFDNSDTNGFIFNNAGNYLEAQVDGKYYSSYMASGDGQNNHIYFTTILLNGVDYDRCESHKKMTAGGDIVTMTGNCFIDLIVGDRIKLGTADIGGTGTGNYYSANLNLIRIGD